MKGASRTTDRVAASSSAQRRPPRFVPVLAASAVLAVLVPQARGQTDTAASSAVDGSSSAGLEGRYSALRYDLEYPVIGYSEKAEKNDIARLQARLDRGEVELRFHPVRGYLDSLLEALGIDASSQTLVYSKTSLQFPLIDGARPRAIYFNDDTYVAWVQDSDLLEFTTMDAELGAVFYAMRNIRGSGKPQLHREMARCLTCHDTFSLMGGGVPRFLVRSTVVDVKGSLLPNEISLDVTDETPLRDRWGGWYVTGRHGSQAHLGNIQVQPTRDKVDIEQVRRGNLDSLEGLFDTTPYITDKSDIVALLVLEHQLHIKNLITRLSFKARTFVARDLNSSTDAGFTWDAVAPRTQRSLKTMLEQLVRAMMFVGATTFTDQITSSSGYDTWFEARGPHDSKGRSLRELDLRTRLFKYPLSYVVYSEAFDNLPDYAREYVYQRFNEVLSGADRSEAFAHLSPADRKAILEILLATKAEFARYVAKESRQVSSSPPSAT